MAGTAVVVGAGVGGLATAIGLRRAGWAVTVLERRSALERYGTAFGIHPTAQTALERLGAGEVLRTRAVPYRGARIRTPQGRVMASLPLERIERKAGRPELLVSRPHLIDALVAELEAFGDVPIKLGENVGDAAGDAARDVARGAAGDVAGDVAGDLARDAAGEAAGDVAGCGARPAALAALSALAAENDLVVGADGIRSAVRAAAFGTRSAPRGIATVAWIGTADFESGVYGETWGKGRFFGMTPVEPGRTNWYATVPGATTADELRPYFEGWHDPVPRILAGSDPATWTRYEMRHLYPALPSFVSLAGAAPTALVGDAAHAMTPNLGQGACTAILDAEALTRAVTAHGPDGLSGALRAYDSERRRSAQRVAFASRTLHRFMSTEHTGLRDALVRRLPS